MANLALRLIIRLRIHVLAWRQRQLGREIRRLRRQREHLAGYELRENEQTIVAAEREARAIDAALLELRDELRHG